MSASTPKRQTGSPLQSVVRRHRRPTRAHDIFALEGGGTLFIDRRVVPMRIKCDQCGNVSPNWAPDEGDGGWWCLDCIEVWEKKHNQHWEDGSPLNPPNTEVSEPARPPKG